MAGQLHGPPLPHQGKHYPHTLSSLLSALKQCTSGKDVALARSLHAHAIVLGVASMADVGTHLLRMLAACGGTSLEAGLAFCCITEPCSVSTWRSILSAYAVRGENGCVLSLFRRMKAHEESIACACDGLSFSLALKACCEMRALGQGRAIHGSMTVCGVESDVVLSTGLITMYAKCRSLDEARCVFDRIAVDCGNVVVWGAMISGYVQLGYGRTALGLLEKMQAQGLLPDRSLFLSALKSCTVSGVLSRGELLHKQIVIMGFDSDVAISSCLLDMYVKSGHRVEAHDLFDRLPARNLVSWGSLIAGYAQHGQGDVALVLFDELLEGGMLPDKFIYSSILKACSSIGAMHEGRCAHDRIIRDGIEMDANLGSTLLDLYAKWGCLEEADKIFRSLPCRNIVSWNVLVSRYGELDHNCVVLELLGKMQHEGLTPDMTTFLFGLKACGHMRLLGHGRLIHKAMIVKGVESDEAIRCSLVSMYSKCGNLDDSQKVFDEFDDKDNVLFASMICGYAQHGHDLYAFELFESMQMMGCMLNRAALSNVLKLCSFIEHGRIMHKHIIMNGLEVDNILVAALVNMYAKCGSVEEAEKVLSERPHQDVVPWNCIIQGYIQNANALAAFECLSKVLGNGLYPDRLTYLSLLRACSNLGVLELGRQLHDAIVIDGFDSNIAVATSLIHMYGRCGNLDAATRVFKSLPTQNVVSWNSMMAASAQHGEQCEALRCLERIYKDGKKPEERTHTAALGLFSKIGRVKDGSLYFEVMNEEGCRMPTTSNENINAFIDLLSRSGFLTEAEEMLYSIANPVDITGLTSFLGACRTYGNMDLGWKFFRHASQQIPQQL